MRFANDLQKHIYYTAQIDFCYYAIQEIANHTGAPQDPLSAMVDKATGFDRFRVKNAAINVIRYCDCLIRCKKKLGYEVDRDLTFRREVKKLIPTNTENIK